MTASWPVERLRGGAGTLHALGVPAAPPARRLVQVLAVDRPALVLGSTQPSEDVAPGVEARVDVVRRRSGGGAVLVEPGRVVWVDVLLRRADPLWDDDVGRSFRWLGRAWAETLVALGCREVVVHPGPLLRTRWSSKICFAGLGPGEVTVAGRKAVGMAQRRTRHGARFQCAVPLAWSAASIVSMLALSPADAAEAIADLEDAVHPLTGLSEDDVVAALLDQLAEV